jgi:hypothetical protein
LRRLLRIRAVICYGPSSRELSLTECVRRNSPLAVVHVDTSFLPAGIEQLDVPTICFNIDAFVGLKWRSYWSRLFDAVVTFHTGTEQAFFNAGARRIECLPHAVEASPFQGDSFPRTIDLAWIGSLRGEIYARRRHVIPALASRFKCNEQGRSYGYEEMAQVLARSRIGINIARDDYPRAANLRCFEVMAAGALLLTDQPSDLEQYGFREGEEYVGFTQVDDIPDRVSELLTDSGRLQRVAAAGRRKVFEGHTYDHRARALVELCHSLQPHGCAPARRLPRHDVEAIYAHYYSKHLHTPLAIKALGRAVRHSLRIGLSVLPTVVWGVVRKLQALMRRPFVKA